MSEIEFEKYVKKGAYHWAQISWHPIKRRAFVAARYRNVLNLVLQSSKTQLKGKKILDLGCGDGVLSCLLGKLGADVFGIDYSFEALRFGKKYTNRYGIKLQRGSAYDLPFKDSSFDIVVSSDVIEHVENYRQFLIEMNRVTKGNGTVVISTPIRYTEYPLDKMHVFEWFQSDFKKEVSSVFPESKFFESHPLCWHELTIRSTLFLLLVNMLSLIKNPFEGFESKFLYKTIQYSLSSSRKT